MFTYFYLESGFWKDIEHISCFHIFSCSSKVVTYEVVVWYYIYKSHCLSLLDNGTSCKQLSLGPETAKRRSPFVVCDCLYVVRAITKQPLTDVSTCGMDLLGYIQLSNIVLFFFQLLSFMYGHITFYHSGKAFIVLC